MSKRKKHATQKPKIGWLIAAALIVGVVIVGGLVISQQSTPGSRPTLRDSDTTFSVPTHVGQTAPSSRPSAWMGSLTP